MNEQHPGHEDHHEHDADDHHDHDHHHGPERGWLAGFRYIKMVRKFWRSDVNNAVVDLVDPRDGEQLIDIGAGMGAASVVAARRVGSGRVTAVDPLPGMRLFASLRRLWPGRWRSMVVKEGTAESLPVADASMDAAWATNAMHHFDDLDAAAVELARVLVPGGRAVFVEEQFTDPEHPAFERFGGADSEHKHRFHAVDLEHISAVMDGAGFDVEEASDAKVAGAPAKLLRLKRR